MAELAAPALYAALLWWGSTGLILGLDHLPPRTHRWSMAGGTLVLVGALAAIGLSAGRADEAAAYTAFTAAILVWGWQEMAYYMGFVSGPRPQACAPNLPRAARFRAALATSLWHEGAIVLGGLVILGLTWHGENRIALWTYLALVALNASARLNLFLGVRNLQTELLPESLRYLACYMARKPMNLLFPVSVSLGTIAAALVAEAALAEGAAPHARAGFGLVAMLIALGVLEHWLLMLPLPTTWLWRWSLPGASASIGTQMLPGVGVLVESRGPSLMRDRVRIETDPGPALPSPPPSPERERGHTREQA